MESKTPIQMIGINMKDRKPAMSTLENEWLSL
jgi:hypothetical protein